MKIDLSLVHWNYRRWPMNLLPVHASLPIDVVFFSQLFHLRRVLKVQFPSCSFEFWVIGCRWCSSCWRVYDWLHWLWVWVGFRWGSEYELKGTFRIWLSEFPGWMVGMETEGKRFWNSEMAWVWQCEYSIRPIILLLRF